MSNSRYNHKHYPDPTAKKALDNVEKGRQLGNRDPKTQVQHDTMVSDYLTLLSNSKEVMLNQSETIKAAIAMRIFNQDVINLLSAINSTGSLTATIDNVTKLNREFDKLAMDYGPYSKADYIAAVVSRSPLGSDNHG